MDFLTSLENDFPELTRGERVMPPVGLAADGPSEEVRTLPVMPPLTRDEVAEPIATVEVTGPDEADAPPPEVVPAPFGSFISNDDLPEVIVVPVQES